MCCEVRGACRLRQDFEDCRNSLSFFIELASSGLEFSERARAGLQEMGEMQLRHLDAAANDHAPAGNAPS